MKAVVLQSNYLPWKGYFDLIYESDIFVFYDEVQYTKNDWRNRNRIYGANGLHWLTIPVPRSSVHLKISQVEITDPYWQARHFKSIRFAYESFPYYARIEPFLKEFYLEKKWKRLSELNQYSIREISRMLGIRTRFLNARDFHLKGGRIGKLIDLLKQVGATQYLTGPSAKNYLKDYEDLFMDAGISILYKDYAGYPPYPQRRSPFIHEVSILDMLVNLPLEGVGEYIWGRRQEDSPLQEVLSEPPRAYYHKQTKQTGPRAAGF